MDDTSQEDGQEENRSPEMDGRFRLKLSSDSLTAHLFQLTAPVGNGKPVTVESVLSKLSKSKIKHGIKRDAIEKALAEVTNGNIPEDPVLIAEGVAPVHGTDAKVEWFIDAEHEDETRRIVLPDQLIANFHPATKGEPGIDIYGKAIRARPGMAMMLGTGDGISSVMAGEVHEYHASNMGILEYKHDKLSVHLPGLTVDKESLSATMDILAFTGGDNPESIKQEHIINALNNNKIVFGIDVEAISNALREAQESVERRINGVIVAKGVPAVKGDNAELDWLINPEEKFKGNRLVVPGQIILRKKFATPGQTGNNIYGKEMRPEAGKDIAVKIGKGIDINQTLEVAEYNAREFGYVRMDKGSLVIVNPAIETSKNELEARMDLYPKSAGENGSEIEVSQIVELLKAAKVTFGIDENNIKKLLTDAKTADNGYLIQAPVAQGIPAVDGEDGSIVWEIKTDSKVENDLLVIPGQTIAIRTFATPGTEGTNIRGKPIKPVPGKDIKIMKGAGISSNIGGNKEEYKSDVLGFVDYFKDSLTVKNPVVKVSDDKLSATMDVYGHSGGKQKVAITAAQVIDAIKHSKITYGFQDKVITKSLEEARASSEGMTANVTVAKGDKEINGEDGYIDWFLDINSEEKYKRIVLAGMRIASRIPATKGTQGKDIYSKPIQPVPGKDKDLKTGDMVEYTKREDHDEYFASIYGIALYADNTLSVEKPNLQISDDGLTATLDIYSHTGGKKPSFVEVDNVMQMLNKCGVTFGIDETAIENSLLKVHAIKGDPSKSMEHDVVIAKGKDKKDGIPAILNIDHKIAPGKRRPNGTIDLHERSYPWDVSEGTELGKFTQAVMAVNGTKVTGKTIPANEVNEVNLKLEGIRIDEDGTLFAELDGTLLIDEFNLRVTDVLVIQGDVDMSTGNIRTKSAVQITGFVTAGFVVEALGEVIVSENVEDAIVRSASSVVIHGGVRGPRSEIFAANNIKSTFVEYGKLVAKNDIILDKSSVDAHLVAGNEIRIGTDQGTLIAGRCEAVRQLWAHDIGHRASGIAEIHLGVSGKKINRKNELMQKDEELTPQEKKELAIIQNMIERSKDAALRVKGKISSDVELYIGANVLKILDEKSYLDFYIDPETRNITFRAYDERSSIPVIKEEEDGGKKGKTLSMNPI